jgi:hypothetical protein
MADPRGAQPIAAEPAVTTATAARLDPRNPQSHLDAEAAVIAASAAWVEADQAVTATREQLAIGKASRGDLVRVQRRLFAASEAKLQSEARVRALAKERDAIALAERDERERARRARAAEHQLERTDLEAEFGAAIATAIASLQAIDARAGALDQRGAAFGSVMRPSKTATKAWDAALGGLSELHQLYPQRGSRR